MLCTFNDSRTCIASTNFENYIRKFDNKDKKIKVYISIRDVLNVMKILGTKDVRGIIKKCHLTLKFYTKNLNLMENDLKILYDTCDNIKFRKNTMYVNFKIYDKANHAIKTPSARFDKIITVNKVDIDKVMKLLYHENKDEDENENYLTIFVRNSEIYITNDLIKLDGFVKQRNDTIKSINETFRVSKSIFTHIPSCCKKIDFYLKDNYPLFLRHNNDKFNHIVGIANFH
jgi:hypothetical protein